MTTNGMLLNVPVNCWEVINLPVCIPLLIDSPFINVPPHEHLSCQLVTKLPGVPAISQSDVQISADKNSLSSDNKLLFLDSLLQCKAAQHNKMYDNQNLHYPNLIEKNSLLMLCLSNIICGKDIQNSYNFQSS